MSSPDSPGNETSSVRPHGKLRTIFVGRDGIRAGWRASLFAAIFAGVAYGFTRIAAHFLPHISRVALIPARFALIVQGLQLCAVAIPTAILAALERKSPFAYGLQGSARGLRFSAGIACGLAAISILVLILKQTGLLELHFAANNGAEAVKYGLIWAVFFIMTGVVEESLLRGYLQYTLARGIGFWWAALLMSLLFGGLHGINHGETPVGLFTAALFGLFFCMTLWYTGSLWWAIGCHAGWDWGQSFLYGTSDSGLLMQGALFNAHPAGNVLLSGGATGPEGSVLIFPMLAVLSVLTWLWWRRAPSSPAFSSRGRSRGHGPAK